MPPQIKQDLNRSGWESTDFPSVCERCLPDNPFVQMLKEDHGAECKLCSRPFTIFRWKADRTARQKRTNICLTCARLKNCCQSCMLDLSFGLSIPVRDAALKMIAPGPSSEVNKQYYAQEHEREIEEGRGATEAYQKTDEKARELLRRLANSEPYHKKQRRLEAEAEGAGSNGQRLLTAGPGGADTSSHTIGPIRTRDTRLAKAGKSAPRRGAAQQPITEQDVLPPSDPNITSLFVTGVEDDLPEHQIRTFFTQFGTLRSIICSHRSHCAFINFQTRKAAEDAAAQLQGKAVVAGVPLRVQWGKPKPLDNMDKDERLKNAKAGRSTGGRQQAAAPTANAGLLESNATLDDLVAVAPPGAEDVNYASLAGN